MPNAKTILTRIVFGLAMSILVAGVLVLEYHEVPANDAGIRAVFLTLGMIPLVVVAFWELRRLALAAGLGILRASGVFGAVLLGTLPFWRQFIGAGIILEDVIFLLGAVAGLAFLEQMIRYRVEGAIARLGVTMLAVLYLGVGTALLLTIRLDHGVQGLVLFLAAVKFTDIGAYFTGVAVGRHKLIPWLSPGKTWEGLLGGIAPAVGASILVVWAFSHVPRAALGLTYRQAAAFGVAMALAGQFGDLCESLLKRAAGVKDSGALVPAFGGILDILDSPLLAAPVAYILLIVLR